MVLPHVDLAFQTKSSLACDHITRRRVGLSQVTKHFEERVSVFFLIYQYNSSGALIYTFLVIYFNT